MDNYQPLKSLEIREIWIRRVSRWFWRVLFVFVSAVMVKWAWTFSMTPVFGIREITYQEAFAFLVLSRAVSGFPEVARTLGRAWWSDQLLNFQAQIQQLFIYYLGHSRGREGQYPTKPESKTDI